MLIKSLIALAVIAIVVVIVVAAAGRVPRFPHGQDRRCAACGVRPGE